MTQPPPAIIFCNGDITYPPSPPIFIGAIPPNPLSDAGFSELTNLQIQLFINDTMTKAEFDARVAADPNYPAIVHLQNMRILVILPTFQDGYNREYADVVIFLHQGLADVERNRFGPPCKNFPIQRLTVYELLRAVGSSSVVILPYSFGGQGGCGTCCENCNYPFYCDQCHTFSGIKICRQCGCGCKCGCNCGLIDQQGVRSSELYAPNCDNIYHNPAFIRRK
jgi:hypothetical protein